MEVIVYIESGKLKHDLKLADGRYLAKFSKKNNRTLPMNAYLHGVLIPEFRNALNSVGYDEVRNDEQVKKIIKSMFLVGTITNKETGEMISFTKDTHELTTLEMSTLFDEVIKFAAENMSYQIPYPNEQLTIL